MRRPIALLFVMAMLAVMIAAVPIGATAGVDEGPSKVWLCHFEDHVAPMPYGLDLNGPAPGFFTTYLTDPSTDLYRDYIVKYNETLVPGIPAGLNAGQIRLCEGNYGKFILVSVNAIGTEEDVRGHGAQLTVLNLQTYPDGWKG